MKNYEISSLVYLFQSNEYDFNTMRMHNEQLIEIKCTSKNRP
ncbi:hypothetical protein GJA_4468 [Janthinobacterium agaricidamnosum NBRC 102515 = DSM 9628]|uniref:Uncharacterized protein n=1 Tax=Janthinobacterium agaricidamnosum NBRC 102515 = DSM 9628 TaxID=1349767 RepID=W0VBS5_9BURK|nr:hypothetical protein GJA_4468 [Janthinobacterium agaricidamnosum NBRC 102515 = DSM 9628]